MPRTLFLLASATVAVLLAAEHASAQTKLAVKAGASIATVGGNDFSGADSRVGLHAGGALTFPLSDAVGIQIGAGYTQKGASASEDGVDGTLALDYIEMPLLLTFAIPTEGAIAPRFFVGPAVAFEASCKFTGTFEGTSLSVGCGAADLATKSIDFGAMAGVGLDIATSGSLSVTLDVLYNLGLSSIDDSGIGADIKNRAFAILGGVALPLG